MNRHSRGFTLLELMAAVTVLGVLLGIAVPTFREVIRNNRVTSQTNELVSSLNYARSEALKRGNPVALCSSTDGATCANSTDWSTGWLLFTDTNVNGQIDGGEQTLQAQPAVPAGISLNSTVQTFVRYNSTGMSAGMETFDLLETGCTGNYARQISITVTGRIASAVVACP